MCASRQLCACFLPAFVGAIALTGPVWAQSCPLDFAPAVNSNAGMFCNAVAVGDVNGDGKADLVVANTRQQ